MNGAWAETLGGPWGDPAPHPQSDPGWIGLAGLIILLTAIDSVMNAPLPVFVLSCWNSPSAFWPFACFPCEFPTLRIHRSSSGRLPEHRLYACCYGNRLFSASGAFFPGTRLTLWLHSVREEAGRLVLQRRKTRPQPDLPPGCSLGLLHRLFASDDSNSGC